MTLISRHILAEVLKTLLLTCSVLVLVIALGAAIRPLAQNQLGAFDTVKYVALATVPMLQFALPVSAGFAATLVLHRFASDNEIQALSTSGLSYRRILRPMVVLGAALAVIMGVLLFLVEPRFWVLLRSTVTRDAARMFVATVQGGQTFEVEKLQIHADEIAEIAAPPGSEADSRLLLGGLVAVEFDGNGVPQTELTAERATIDVYRTSEGTFLKPLLANATVFRAVDGTLVELPSVELDAARIDRPYVPAPKHMTLGQLRAVRENLAGYPPVASRLEGLRAVAAEADAWRAVDAALRRGDGTLTLVESTRGRRFTVRDATLAGDRLVPRAGERLTVVEEERGRPLRSAEGPFVLLTAVRPDPPAAGGAISFELALAEPTPLAAPAGTAGGAAELDAFRWPRRVGGLRLEGTDGPGHPGNADLEPPAALSRATPEREAADLVAAATLLSGPTARLAEEARGLGQGVEWEVRKFHRSVFGSFSRRIALALAAPLLPLLGAVLAIWRRTAPPLEIYVISFVPTIANVLLISAGEQLLLSERIGAGLAIMASGPLALLVMLVVAGMRLGRH